jgi:hypothetical protein
MYSIVLTRIGGGEFGTNWWSTFFPRFIFAVNFVNKINFLKSEIGANIGVKKAKIRLFYSKFLSKV